MRHLMIFNEKYSVYAVCSYITRLVMIYMDRIDGAGNNNPGNVRNPVSMRTAERNGIREFDDTALRPPFF